MRGLLQDKSSLMSFTQFFLSSTTLMPLPSDSDLKLIILKNDDLQNCRPFNGQKKIFQAKMCDFKFYFKIFLFQRNYDGISIDFKN